MGNAVDQRLACSLRPIFCAFAPFPAAMAMFSAASTLVRTSVVMPQRDSCAKRACPASASQGAGLPYPPEKLRSGNRLEPLDADRDADQASEPPAPAIYSSQPFLCS